MKRRTISKILTGIFAVFLGTMGVLSAVSPQKAYSQSERRYLTKKPEVSWSAVKSGKFSRDYDAYLNDQFPGRNAWVGMQTALEYAVGKRDSNGVYFGKDGYLMEKLDREDLDTKLLDRNLNLLASFASRAADSLGTERVRIMLVPSASQVLTEKLPNLAAPWDQGAATERLAGMMGEKRDLIVDVESALWEAKGREIYYRTDHHWTAEGAYAGYRAWADSLGLKALKEDQFRVEAVSDTFRGTVVSKLNIPWRADEIRLYLPKTPREYRVFYDGQGEWEDSLYRWEALKGFDQYSVFLDGNHGLTEIQNGSAKSEGRKLLVIKDSFANSFIPFAVNHFETVYMADLRYLNVNLEEWMTEHGVSDLLVLYQIPGFAGEKSVSKMRLGADWE